MTLHAAPHLTLPKTLDGPAPQIAIVASSWHPEIMDALIAGAQRAVDEAGGQAVVVRVAGSFELPLVTAHAARTHAAVVALGVVLRGETAHFDYVCTAATEGLMRVSLDAHVPVGDGLLTCDRAEQAWARCGVPGASEDKGYDACQAALLSLASMQVLSQ